MEALLKIKQARAAMLVDCPFFGELSLKLILKEDTTEGMTMWTDGMTLGYNPDWVLKQSAPKLTFVVAHEVAHCALSHQLRRNNRDHEMWNEACDYAVNAMLQQYGWKLPEDCYYDPQYGGKSAEAIFNIINGKKGKKDKQEDKQGDSNSQTGAGNDFYGQGQGDTLPENKNGSTGQTDSQLGDCPKGHGEVRDYPGNTDKDEAAQQEQEWKQAAAAAAIHAEQAGKCPGNFKKLIQELIESKVNWQEVLQRFVNEQARDDYSWRRTNSRYAHTGFVLPALQNEKLPPLVVAIDTSGSISDKDLQQFASECEEILSLYDTTLRVVMIDTEVRHTQDFSREDMPIKFEMFGGGGTKFAPLFEHVNGLEETPLAVIYLTDLQCKDYGPEPDYPVLWIQTSNNSYYERYYGPPPFGEVTKMHQRF